ncbi:MAG: GTPase domain-containing protein, partial [Myxococcota bacterium]
MASINYQRKGIRISIALFGPEDAGKSSVLSRLNAMCSNPPEIMTAKEDGGKVLSFFAPLAVKKLEGVELLARFLTAEDHKGDGRIWASVLRQTDGVIFIADSTEGREADNLKAHELLKEHFPTGIPETALVFIYNKQDKDKATSFEKLNAVLNPLGRPSFMSDPSGKHDMAEAAQYIVRASFQRYQQQFEAMGGKGKLGERISLELAGDVSGTHGNEPLQEVKPLEDQKETPGSSEPPADIAESTVTAEEISAAVAETLSEIASESEPPATEAPAAPFDDIAAVKKLDTVAGVISRIPEVCEGIAHVGVAIRMLAVRMEGLEKKAATLGQSGFDPETSRAIGERLSVAAAIISRLEAEKLELKADAAVSSKALLAAVEAAEAATNRSEQLDRKLSESVREVESFMSEAGRLESGLAASNEALEAARKEAAAGEETIKAGLARISSLQA